MPFGVLERELKSNQLAFYRKGQLRISELDREYLEDYEQKEKAEYEKLAKRIIDGTFDLERDRFPPDERFIKLQKPVSDTTARASSWEALWSQVPFCGSLVLYISPVSSSVF